MPLTDAMFLLGETREHPMHVGGLQVFHLPEGAGPDYLGDVYREVVANPHVDRLFRRRATRSFRDAGQWGWVEDDALDIEYHVRLSALPQPGRVRELLALTSRLHGTLLDRHRPLWEGHLIEGLEKDRFAVYTKMSHAMLDGVSALRLLQEALSEDPTLRGMPAPWALGDGRRKKRSTSVPGPLDVLSTMANTVQELAGVAPALLSSVRRTMSEEAAASPFQAPRTMFNVPITGARRFAAQSWDLARIRAVRKATGATLNDVVLAMSSGALRQYLLDHDALPDQPLISMVPVSLRPAEGEDGGNSVGMILCNLATDEVDPARRLAAIRDSMDQAKANLAGLSQTQILALNAITMAPLAVSPMSPVAGIGRPVFNLVISNVPGPPNALYWNGARLEGIYPLSIPLDGQAVNITVTTYESHLEFGLVSCRQKVPHLQRMLDHLESSLAALEHSVGLTKAPRNRTPPAALG